MLVCTRSFAYIEDGEEERCRAGITHVTADHSLVARFPDAWAPSTLRCRELGEGPQPT